MQNFKKQNFIDRTISEFQMYKSEKITETEANEIKTNFFGYIQLLMEWRQTEDTQIAH